MKYIRNNFLFQLSFLMMFLLLFSGCASTHRMSLTPETQNLDLNNKALILMSLQLNHAYKPGFQPAVRTIQLESLNADTKGEQHNFIVDEDGAVQAQEGVLHMLRMEVDPGQYVIRGASAMYMGFPITAHCFMPIHTDIDVKPNTVTYVGRATGVTRKRQKGEFRSGPMIPLIDQGVAGFTMSTFDVELSDQRDDDLKTFGILFPALVNADIGIDILPPFDRQRATNWWENDGKEDTQIAKTPEQK
jgi:hypothetical protein